MRKIAIWISLILLLMMGCATQGINAKKAISEVKTPNIDLCEDMSRDGRQVYRITGDKFFGYQIDAYLVIPEQIRFGRLLVYPDKVGSQGCSIDYVEERIRQDINMRNVFYGLNAVELWPVIPQDNPELMRLGLDLNIAGKYNRLDQQVCRLLDVVYAFLEEKEIRLSDKKIVLTGYSGAGQFCTRFAMLHPEMVSVVCAGGLSWSPVLPVKNLDGKTLDWPLGINNYKEIAGYDFNLSAWKEIRYCIDNGLLDDRGSCNQRMLSNAGFETSSYPSIWDKFTDVLVQKSDNIQVITYVNLGHQRVGADVLSFLKANDRDEFVRITSELKTEVK